MWGANPDRGWRGSCGGGNACVYWSKATFGVAKQIAFAPGWKPTLLGRKKGCLADYKKSIFCPLEKDGFFAVFENQTPTLIRPNEYKHLANTPFFVFTLIWVKNGLKKNILSNLP